MSQRRSADDATVPVERKLQLTGNSTFVVSLPKAWATAQNLESGMSMYLYPADDRVVAAPERVSTQERAVTIDARTDTSDGVERQARAAYAAGYDRITVTDVTGLDAEQRRALERTVSRLIGLEIQEMTDEQITIADVLDASEISLSQTVTQARQLTLEHHADAVDAVVTNDHELARQVQSRERDVTRLFAFVSRGVHRGLEDVHEITRLGTDRTTAFREYRIARQLERITDHTGRIAAVAQRQSGPPDEALGAQLESIAADTRRVVEQALAGEHSAALETEHTVRDVTAGLDEQLSDCADPNIYLYGSVLEQLRQTAASGIRIAETTTESGLDN